MDENDYAQLKELGAAKPTKTRIEKGDQVRVKIVGSTHHGKTGTVEVVNYLGMKSYDQYEYNVVFEDGQRHWFNRTWVEYVAPEPGSIADQLKKATLWIEKLLAENERLVKALAPFTLQHDEPELFSMMPDDAHFFITADIQEHATCALVTYPNSSYPDNFIVATKSIRLGDMRDATKALTGKAP